MDQQMEYGVVAVVIIIIIIIIVLFMIYAMPSMQNSQGGSGVGFWDDGRTIVLGTGGTSGTWGAGSSNSLISVFLISAKTSGVEIGVKNNVEEDLILKSVGVINCGEVYPGRVLTQNQSVDFNIPCALEPGSKFAGEIVISYYRTGSMDELIFQGAINPDIP